MCHRAKQRMIANTDNNSRCTSGEAVETSFTKGVNAVSWVLIRFMLVMVQTQQQR